MFLLKAILLNSLCITSICFVHAQSRYTDTSHFSGDEISNPIALQTIKNKNAFHFKGILVPTTFIIYGAIAIDNNALRRLNQEARHEVYTEHPHRKFRVDDYLQFAPAAAVYGLNIMGVKGKNNLRDRSVIYLTSNIILNTTVFSVKKLTHVQRPDGSANNSFPSGHGAEAFASAEFLYQEYKDISPWYGIGGYVVAAATGYLRMYNNKHWLSDVIAGAGVGMVSTKLAYWIYPEIQKRLFKGKPVNTIIAPTYQSGSIGFGMVHQF